MAADQTSNNWFAKRALEVYFLPLSPWEDVCRLQQRLVYEMGDAPRQRAALLIVEHPAIITVGRHGSSADIRADDLGDIEVKWVNRGGGAWFQAPGQLAVYPILPLEENHFTIHDHRERFYRMLLAVAAEFKIPAERCPCHGGVFVGNRVLAGVGIAVKNWVSYHGGFLNLALPPGREKLVCPHPNRRRALETCLLREHLHPIRPAAVRESVVRQFVGQYGFESYYLCHGPKLSTPKKSSQIRVR